MEKQQGSVLGAMDDKADLSPEEPTREFTEV